MQQEQDLFAQQVVASETGCGERVWFGGLQKLLRRDSAGNKPCLHILRHLPSNRPAHGTWAEYFEKRLKQTSFGQGSKLEAYASLLSKSAS